jgi:hypothetical protein
MFFIGGHRMVETPGRDSSQFHRSGEPSPCLLRVVQRCSAILRGPSHRSPIWQVQVQISSKSLAQVFPSIWMCHQCHPRFYFGEVASSCGRTSALTTQRKAQRRFRTSSLAYAFATKASLGSRRFYRVLCLPRPEKVCFQSRQIVWSKVWLQWKHRKQEIMWEN